MRPWDDNTDGFYFINAGVGAVHQPRRTVEADFAIHARFQTVIEIFVHKQSAGSSAPEKRTGHKKAHKTPIFRLVSCVLCASLWLNFLLRRFAANFFSAALAS